MASYNVIMFIVFLTAFSGGLSVFREDAEDDDNYKKIKELLKEYEEQNLNPPTNLKATATSPEAVKLSWDAPNNIEENVTVDYNITYKEQDNILGSETTNDTKSTISDLKSCVNYTFEVYAILEDEEISEPATTTCTTLTEDSPPIRNLATSDVTENSVTITWDPPDTRCKIETYKISWSTPSNVVHYTDLTGHQLKEHLILTNLTADTTYDICVSAATETKNENELCVTRSTIDRLHAPLNVKASSKSHEITLEWERPDNSDDHNIMFYEILCTDEDGYTDQIQIHALRATINKLHACTLYTLQVYGVTGSNVQGDSAGTTSTTTIEDSPPVQNLTVLNATSDGLLVVWESPATQCDIKKYSIYWSGVMLWGEHLTISDATNITNIQDDYSLEIDDLIPLTNYTICVLPITNTDKGTEACTQQITYADAPSEFPIVDIIAENYVSISVSWTKPEMFNGNFKKYTLSWSCEKDGTHSDTLSSSDADLYIIGNLRSDTPYTIVLTAHSDGGETSYEETIPTPKDPTTPVAIGLTVTVLIICLAGAAFWFFKLRKTGSPTRTRNSTPSSKTTNSVSKNEALGGPISISEFNAYVRSLQEDQCLRLSQEFKQVQEEDSRRSSCASARQNHVKNRDMNCIPYEYNRVILQQDADRDDYINASLIMNNRGNNFVIATQDPMDSTKDDFWKMVWQQNTATIVTMTSSVGDGENRCVKYWPGLNEDMHLPYFTITNVKEECNFLYITRVFQLKTKTNIRELKQFHFTSWPSRSLPGSESYLLDFIQTIKQYHKKDGQMIVHCSNGGGRTGVFICLWLLIEDMTTNSKATVDIKNCVIKLRRQRTSLVQTENDYLYIYKCMMVFIKHKEKWKNGDRLTENFQEMEELEIGKEKLI